jgi:hypothetical protein
MKDQLGQALLESIGICMIGIVFVLGAFTVLGFHFQRLKCERTVFERGLVLRAHGQLLSSSRCGGRVIQLRFSEVQ